MKVETEIMISAPAERIWKILTDFSAYPDWNPYITAVRGAGGPAAAVLDARLQFDLTLYLEYGTRNVKKLTEPGRVSGAMAPRYFSWEWDHPWGRWWLSAERVFRLKEREDGRVLFFNEAFYTGFSMVKLLGFLDFRRDAIERKAKLSMIKMNEALKERAEAA